MNLPQKNHTIAFCDEMMIVYIRKLIRFGVFESIHVGVIEVLKEYDSLKTNANVENSNHSIVHCILRK